MAKNAEETENGVKVTYEAKGEEKLSKLIMYCNCWSSSKHRRIRFRRVRT